MNDSDEEAAVIIVLVCFAVPVVFVNLFAIISILKHCSRFSTCAFVICCLSTVEVFHAVTCTTTSVYSHFNREHSFERNSVLCTFYAWLYVTFRLQATTLVSILVLDRVVLSLYPTFYIRTWGSLRTRVILGAITLLTSIVLSTIPLQTSSFHTAPDGPRLHCFYKYTSNFAIFYVIFHLSQTAWTFLAMPCVIAREQRVDARLSVLLVREMSVSRKGSDVTRVRDELLLSRLVAAVVCVYHACSVMLPIVLILHSFDVSYPSVVGILALQLPNLGSLFLPLLYGFIWRPFRTAYYNSLNCCCPTTTSDVRLTQMPSMVNPAFCETRDDDSNSILHAGGLSLHPVSTANSRPSTQSQQHLQLDPGLLEDDSTGYDTFRPVPTTSAPQVAPRNTSTQGRHYYTPSKFQNIFEIIEALSAPRRESVGSLSSTNTPRRNDSVSSVDSESPAVKLNDVSLTMPERESASLRGVDFSSVHFSATPYNLRKVDKLKLELSSSVRGDEVTQTPPIRFTDLKRVRTESRPENFNVESPLGNEQRFRQYLANENR